MIGELDGAITGAEEGVGNQKGYYFCGIDVHFQAMKQCGFPGSKCFKIIHECTWVWSWWELE
jgi:hypothetical protein